MSVIHLFQSYRWTIHLLTNKQVASLTATFIFISYLTTLAPTIFINDSAELVAGAFSQGIVHPPGYSVYLLIAKLFTYLPIGDIAYRVNLLSAVSTVFALFILVILLQQLGVSRLVASISGMLFAFSFYTWSLSVITEVYTFQLALLMLLLWSAWKWRQAGNPHHLYSVTFFLGLSAANNPATLLWWLGIALMLGGKQSFRWRVIGKAAVFFICGLAFVLYLPIRSQSNNALNYMGHYDQNGFFHPVNLAQIDNLLWYLTGGPFHSWMGNYTLSEIFTEFKTTILRLNAAFLGIGLPLGLWGVASLWRKKAIIAAAFLMTFLPHLIFFTVYHAPDKDTMFLPVYLVWTLFIGLGLSRFMLFMPRKAQLGLFLLPLLFFIINRPFIDLNNHYETRIEAYERLESAEPDSIYFGFWGDAAAMHYLQITENVRPDVRVINVFMAPPPTQQEIVSTALQNGHSVYFTFQTNTIGNQFDFVSIVNGFQIQRSK